MLRLVFVAREFFFSWKIACDQHRANKCCAERGSGVLHPPRAK
ncbi:unnamed protein product [Staurois parvus]|uniref:Uncharacterized protein n=1 Tax=Staurois parvus TaxID=386267 RepID=A0ABN9BR65_9NEOB|nr:unnamed protein product [Staurois parvus]